MKIHQAKSFIRAQRTADRMIHDSDYSGAFLDQAIRKLIHHADRLRVIYPDFKMLMRLVGASLHHKDGIRLDGKKLLFSVAVIVYFLNPFDVIPDFVPAGYTDDIALILLCLTRLKKQIQDFRRQESQPKAPTKAPEPAPTQPSPDPEKAA